RGRHETHAKPARGGGRCPLPRPPAVTTAARQAGIFSRRSSGLVTSPVELARAHVPPAVAGKQPGLAEAHPSLLARDAPPFAQQLEKVGRENDIPILLALALL